MLSLEEQAADIADAYLAQLPPAYEGRYSEIAEPSTVQTLLEAFRDGLNAVSACQAAGIHPDTLKRWLARAETDAPDNPFARFATALKREKAQGQMSLLKRLKKLGETQWLPNAWLLERTDQEQFALKKDREESGPRVVVQIGVSAPEVSVQVLSVSGSPSLSPPVSLCESPLTVDS